MTLATVHSRAELGLNAPAVKVEVHIAGGLPGMTIVGLPEAAVRESRDRVRAALLSSGFTLPPRRITVNLAPADLPKHGGRFDLPIAIGILAATGQIAADIDGLECVGELSLAGELRAVRGLLPTLLACRRSGRRLIAPAANLGEAALLEDAPVHGAQHLLECCAGLQGRGSWCAMPQAVANTPQYPDLADVNGQELAKRALLIAAAGRHNLLLFGPPGSGKSMLARRLPGLLPPLDDEQALDVAAIESLAGDTSVEGRWRSIPMRTPHHTSSAAALVGGGSHPRPGEISRACHGLLYLDELPEFSRTALEALREPLETGEVCISRAARQVHFPARFQLIAAMNPCPCGYLGDAGGRCRCTLEQVQRYRARISGPLLDRIDMHIPVPRVDSAELLRPHAGTGSAAAREQVLAARARQLARQGKPNADLDAAETASVVKIDGDGRRLLTTAVERLRLSARGIHRVLRLAQTIADLDDAPQPACTHLAEALQLRQFDREAPG